MYKRQIHADSSSSSTANGFSVYALSERGATSEAARELANRENGFLEKSANRIVRDNIIDSVLLDLQQVSTVYQSLTIARLLLHNLKKIEHAHINHVEQAAFVVLKSINIPSVLIETGFVSNKNEAKLLSSDIYQSKIADKIVMSILTYFKPRLSHSSTAVKPKKYISVHKGDTLYKIAKKYNVEFEELMKQNDLTSSNIKLGQKLLISRGK